MAKKKEWSFKEVFEIVDKFNELAETGRYSSLAEIYNKLADDFNCTEEDVLSIFNTLNDDYDHSHLVKTYPTYERARQVVDTLSTSEKFRRKEESIKEKLKLGIEDNVHFLIALQRWKKLVDERFNN